jgi:hypothetical protein
MTYGSMKVADLRAECQARGLDDGGKKADLVARLESSAPTPAAAAAPTDLTKDDPADMNITQLRKELKELDEPTDGRKADLCARLTAARAAATATGTSADGPPAKKAKTAAPTWFWASDASPGVRVWTAYPPAVCADLEAARSKAAPEHKVASPTTLPTCVAPFSWLPPARHAKPEGCSASNPRPSSPCGVPQISATHVVVLGPSTGGLYTQKRIDNAHLIRPVRPPPPLIGSPIARA